MTNEPTLLVVDDDRFVRTLLREVLIPVSGRILEAANGDEALAAISREMPKVVLLDLFMPERSGLEVLLQLRALYPQLPVLVVSMMDSGKLVDQALAAGAVGFIAKPFHPVEIVSAVTRALEVANG